VCFPLYKCDESPYSWEVTCTQCDGRSSYKVSCWWVIIQDQRRWPYVFASFMFESLCDTLHKPISTLSEGRNKSCLHMRLGGSSCFYPYTCIFLWRYWHPSSVSRRLSDIGVAQRVGEERAEETGKTVCKPLRLVSKMSSIRLLYCTPGILLLRFESEPHYRSVCHIVVHKVEETREQSYFLLMILRELSLCDPTSKWSSWVQQSMPISFQTTLSNRRQHRFLAEYFNRTALLGRRSGWDKLCERREFFQCTENE
jgi:hypothetical protein